MPIYAYKCTDCGHEKEVLQKMSDAPLTDCPDCGHPSLAKQVTAAGFQLKGTGWYATDFRNKGTGKPAETANKPADGKPAETKTEAANDAKADTASVDKKPAASANSCGGNCACH